MRRSALFSLAATAVTVAASLQPAHAAAMSGTLFTDLTASTTTVGYEHRTVTVQGHLHHFVQRQRQPLAGVPVQIKLGGVLGTATTDADGAFTATVDLPSGGILTVAFAGDAQNMSSWANVANERAQQAPSRVLLDPAPSSVRAGTAVTLTGVAQISLGGVWKPLPQVRIDLVRDRGAGDSTTTGDDGRFRFEARADVPDAWTARLSYDSRFYYDSGQAGAAVIEAYDNTRFVFFKIPKTNEAHRPGQITGRVQWSHGTQWGAPADPPIVSVFYRPKGSRAWHTIGGTQTDDFGNFSMVAYAPMGAADWQARVIGDHTNLASTSATAPHTITDQGHFANPAPHADRSSRGTTVYGHLQDWYDGQHTFSNMGGLKVGLYYRRAGSRTWHWYRTTKTTKTGMIYIDRLGLGKGYYFRLYLPAQGAYLAATSKTF
ncbi:hypothetical protein [Actinomadura rupiterrae]|uniref:hypothetical protein n=1 Tax=Actinomadura rupiterrae TaxID=559627 RepID=UPI0020A2ADAD|nr:hypothetical protein [Actinomadura rupiterrae]MCP2343760.1 hypothetical protein [Actinomadura rupiterrae]